MGPVEVLDPFGFALAKASAKVSGSCVREPLGFSLLLAPRLALRPGLARHAVGGEDRDDGEALVRKPGFGVRANGVERAGPDDAAVDKL